MSSENSEVFDLDYSAEVIFVFFIDMGQERYLDKGLFDKLLSLFYYFHCQKFFVFMIEYLQHLSKSAFVYRTYYLIPVTYVVTRLIHVKITTLVKNYS